MNFRTVEKKMKGLPCFSLQHLKSIEPKFLRWNLIQRHQKGYIHRISKGRYCFSESPNTEEQLFKISNLIYQPSYISMESALRHYNLIPEGVYQTTACTSKKTQTLQGEKGVFAYSHLNPKLFWGYYLVKNQALDYYLAKVEKAICDFFYLKPRLKKQDFKELRISSQELQKLTTPKALLTCAKDFHHKKLLFTIQDFITYAFQDAWLHND